MNWYQKAQETLYRFAARNLEIAGIVNESGTVISDYVTAAMQDRPHRAIADQHGDLGESMFNTGTHWYYVIKDRRLEWYGLKRPSSMVSIDVKRHLKTKYNLDVESETSRYGAF